MKNSKIIIVGGISALGIGAYLYFNKNKSLSTTSNVNSIIPKYSSTTPKVVAPKASLTPAEISKNAFLPESVVIKASDVIIPKTAVVLPTVALIVQSSVIQEEDINSLDCASLFLKYHSVNSELVSLVTRLGSNQSNIDLLKNRKALIEQVMKNKNCVIKDAVLESAIIEQKIIAPIKYTNAEISQIASTSVTDLMNKPYSKAVTRFPPIDKRYSATAKKPSNYIPEYYPIFPNSQYTMTIKLEDFLKTLKTKEDVKRFVSVYPILARIKAELYSKDKSTGGKPASVDNSKFYDEAKSTAISSIDSKFLQDISFKTDYIF